MDNPYEYLPDIGGPIRCPIPCANSTSPYAVVKSSKETSCTSKLGVNVKEAANSSPKVEDMEARIQ